MPSAWSGDAIVNVCGQQSGCTAVHFTRSKRFVVIAGDRVKRRESRPESAEIAMSSDAPPQAKLTTIAMTIRLRQAANEETRIRFTPLANVI